MVASNRMRIRFSFAHAANSSREVVSESLGNTKLSIPLHSVLVVASRNAAALQRSKSKPFMVGPFDEWLGESFHSIRMWLATNIEAIA